MYPTTDPNDVPDDWTLRKMEETGMTEEEIREEEYGDYCYNRFQDMD